MANDTRVPVIIVSGFLGAGKTTLLKSVLANPVLANTMVIVNEIGEVGIDHRLLERSEDETILLDNGCMCCQLRGDLQALLVDLMMRVNRGSLPSFERVVIEMSGLADPGPVAQTLYSDAGLMHDYRVARIATLIDPVHLDARMAEASLAESQVAAADLLIFTKTDLATSDQVQSALAWAKSINGFARCAESALGDVDIALLADTQTFDDTMRIAGSRRHGLRIGEMLPGSSESSDVKADIPATEEGSYLLRRLTLHSSRVNSFSLHFAKEPSRHLFEYFLSTLVRLRGEDLLRVKGIIRFCEQDQPYLIQGVRHVFSTPVLLDAALVQDMPSTLVFVARDLTVTEVESLWHAMSAISTER